MKLSRFEIGVLISYLILVIYVFFNRLFITSFYDFSKISLFIIAFAPAFFGYCSPIGNSFVKILFSVAWILISITLALAFYIVLEPLQVDSKFILLKFSLLPTLGFIYFQIIRFIYKLIFNREPIAKFVGYASSGVEIAHGRKSDIYDKIFTVASFFGVMIILIQLMKIEIWFL
jgi:hypothetical protein